MWADLIGEKIVAVEANDNAVLITLGDGSKILIYADDGYGEIQVKIVRD